LREFGRGDYNMTSTLTCGIFLVNKNNEILVVHPTHGRKNSWGIPKGMRDPDEVPREAAIREFNEETGIDIIELLGDPKKLKFLGSVKYPKKNKCLIAFWATIPGTIPIDTLFCESMVYPVGKPPFPEVDGYKWLDLDKASELLHAPQPELLPLLKGDSYP